MFTNIHVAANSNGTNYNFGELPPSSLSGFVYDDANNNGVKEASDLPISGVTVTLTGTDDLGAAVNIIKVTLTKWLIHLHRAPAWHLQDY